eukprot:gene8027-8677_t
MSQQDQLVRVFSGHTGAINAVRLTHDGNYCMTASDDKSIRLWNPNRNVEDEIQSSSNQAPSAYCIQAFTGVHGYSVVDIAITLDKSKFASGGDDKACFLWDVAGNRVMRRIQAHNLRTNSLCFNQDGSVLYTASYDKTVKCWDLRANQRDPIQTLSDFTDSVTFVRQSSSAIFASSVDGTVRIYDMRQGFMHTDRFHDPVTSLQVSEDEKTYLATCLGGKIRMMEVGGGKLLKEYFNGHQHQHFKIESCFENNYSSIVTGSEDGSIVHYQIITGDVLRRTENAHKRGISSISYHPMAESFITASYDGEAKLWNCPK